MKLGATVRKIESKRWGLLATSALVGILFMALAAVYVTPMLGAVSHGIKYSWLSVNPYDFEANNLLQLRILTPLIAHYLFLRGSAYIFLPLIMGGLFLSAVYFYYRREGLAGGESLGMVSMLAFTAPIASVLHFMGYVDTTSYLLIFLVIVFIKRPVVWVPLYSLALLNYESGLFAAPWIVMLANMRDFSLKRYVQSLLLVLVALLPMVMYRYGVYLGGGRAIANASSTFLSLENVKSVFYPGVYYMGAGIFGAFKLLWFFPLWAVYSLWRKRGRRREAVLIGLIVFCAMLQLLIASDVTRLMGLAFPAVLFGAVAARKDWGKKDFSKRLWLLVGFNFLVPQYQVIASTLVLIQPLPVSLVLKYVFGVGVVGL